MCCFSRPVDSVANTKIFGRLSGQGTQYVVYQMQYESKSKNAMILPIPTATNPTEDSVKFVDLKEYDDFFADLQRAFPTIQPSGWMLPPTTSKVALSAAPLKVQQVGDFVASVVPTVNDFSRLDPMFSIQPETWAKIPIYSDYSFVVFQLESLEGRPHPMAFEFQSRHNDKIFFPTVHIHDGEVHTSEDFDHTLYCQHAGYDNVVGSYSQKVDMQTGWTRSKEVAKQTMKSGKAAGVVLDELLLHKRTLKGRLMNEDIFADAVGNPIAVQRSWPRSLVTLSPVLGIGALAVAWLVQRRVQRARHVS